MTSAVVVSNVPALSRKLRRVLMVQLGMKIVGEAVDEDGAVALAEKFRADLLLVDLTPTATDAVGLICTVLRWGPSVQVVVLYTSPNDPRILGAIAAGASGCVPKTELEDVLGCAVQQVMAGQFWLPLPVTNRLIADYRRLVSSRPTPDFMQVGERERQMLLLVVAGLSNKEIARELRLAVSTVKNLLSRIYDQIGVNKRTAAVALMLKHQTSTQWADVERQRELDAAPARS